MRVLVFLSILLAGCSSTVSTAPGGSRPSGPGPSPWSANDPVAPPPVVLEEWRKAGNRATCAPMTIADPGERARGGTARRANFSGGWAVAWDVPGLPGREGSGVSCATCGRGVYGLAGAGITWGEDQAEFPHRIEWANGEYAGFGLEGGNGPNWLAQVRVSGQSCVYYVWSFLGREHLEQLLGNLRRVSGSRGAE